ncbi:uncharacterized protein BX664DRAFT_327226 [Halteromyces radiatus]|uniref:uncharacterized protein n=1 Tax=Halteromyces radiatus TaxID=101107 RepID=UPI00221E815F|nr:uncharacterized protein BX664DRAFT_327226 [Halteromyces radiatus]KAI8097773.1 hypothetical protein BX664DRAFT_327226 [Halteromyces radiatus]
MGIFTEDIQKTSVTLYIEKLSNYEEIEWYQFQQLIESMNMQENGPREAIEAIRKRLKHGTQEQKLRILEILKLLMENSPQQFRQQLGVNDKMRERFEFMLSSPMESMVVKKQLVSLLGAWSMKYKGEPGMRMLANMYQIGLTKLGLGRHSRSTSTSQTSSSSPPPPQSSQPEQQQQQQRSPIGSPKRRSMPPPTKPNRPETSNQRKTKPRSQSNATRHEGSTSVFDFAAAKPKIIQEIALANQHVNQLVNALKLLDTREDRWEIDLQHDKRLQEYRQECEDSKKKIVKYARLVEDEEWIGTLLSTNEELLKALDMYDIMSVGEIPANLISSPNNTTPVSHQIAYHNDTSTIDQDLAGLQLDHRTESSEPVVDEEDDPFADPFADPVDTGSSYGKQRQHEYVL